MRTYCCIKDCPNKNVKTAHTPSENVKFYSFPSNNPNMPWLQQKRILWINAVKRYVKHPDNWQPRNYTVICSAHFVANEKSQHPSHPSYLPTIFPGSVKVCNSMQKRQRWERQHRAARLKQNKLTNFTMAPQNGVNTPENDENNSEFDVEPSTKKVPTRSITCQTDECIIETSGDTHNYFMCNLNNIDGVKTAEVQVNIVVTRTVDKISQVNIPILKVNTRDSACDPIVYNLQSLNCPGFHGIRSLKSEENFSAITGVSKTVFELLLNSLPNSKTSRIDKKTKLLITLMKLKTGLRYSALSTLYQVHQTTVQRIFVTTISQLNILLKKFIIWPSKATIQSTMPEVFKIHYPNTRVIIDCTEIYTEHPPEVRGRVLLYSDYKHNHTVKILIGCTPCGLISYVSKCYGGRASDGFITNDCGIINLLEPGDVVLANKGFPTIRTSVEKKNAIIVLPPFLHNPQFPAEEVNETYKIASVRIHIERVNQRLKNFHILDKLPMSLLPVSDEIIYVICALVNVENPIIKQ